MKAIKSNFSMPLLLALLLAGGGILAAAANASPAGEPDSKQRCEASQGQNMQSRMQERRTQHLASLKEKLKLAPEQEAAWNAFTASMQPGMRNAGADPQARRAEIEKLGTVERMDRMTAMVQVRHTHMTQRAEAIKSFYTQLTPEQQKVFDAEAMPRHEQRGHRHGRQV